MLLPVGNCVTTFSEMALKSFLSLQGRSVAANGLRWLTNTSSISMAEASTSSATEQSSSSNHGQASGGNLTHKATLGSIYAACVLERLPVIMTAAPEWEQEQKLWLRSENLRDGFTKEYPKLAVKKDEQSSNQMKQDLRDFKPVPSTTPEDSAGDCKSMKRRLDQRLFLLVKRKPIEGEPGIPGPSKPAWRFPIVRHEAGESLRQAGERALLRVVGRAHPIFFVGNAPMAHLTSVPAGSSTFFMLSQVVGDPWSVELTKDSGCEDVAWVTKEELPKFLEDPRISDLAARML